RRAVATVLGKRGSFGQAQLRKTPFPQHSRSESSTYQGRGFPALFRSERRNPEGQPLSGPSQMARRQHSRTDQQGHSRHGKSFVPGSFNNAADYARLKAKLEAVDLQFGVPGSRVFYLSIPPQLVSMCVSQLRDASMVNDPDDRVAFTRAIVEKPIGRDLESAR